MRLFKTLILLTLLLLPALPLLSQGPAAAPLMKQCADFVQQFYDGYTAKEKALMKNPGVESLLETTLKEKKSSFAPNLIQALTEDLEASKKVPDEIVGLDFDPFLNAQDVGERYLVGKVTPKGDRYWVEVFGIWGGKKNTKPDVLPELAFKDGQWIFTNFHYGKANTPVNENLLSVLQQLKKDRQKAK